MLTDAVLLDISQAQRQIDQLEAELRRLSQPVRVPVDIDGGQAADELRRDFQGADAGVAELNAELAETDRELDRIRTSADRAGRELDSAGRKGASSFNGMAVAAGAFGVALAAAVGVRAFVGFAGDAIQAASDFEESLSKTNIVFGEFSDEIVKFAETGPQALGLATREALAFTSTFGNLFVALGLSQEAAAELSPEIVQLGADLASFNNIDVAEALEKLRSGLVGEAEPLHALGVNINETVVQAKALELGLGGLNGELSEAEKVQARYALIVEQTATAQGDFARTADGVANRQRTLTAEFRDVQAAIGEALLPAFESLLDAGPALIGAIEGLIPVFANLANAIAGLDASGIGDFIQTISAIPTVFDTAGTAITGLADIIVGSLQSLSDQGGGFDRTGAGVERLSNAVDQFNLAKLRNGIINALQEGRDPALALADALVVLSDKGLDLDELSSGAEELANIANLDTSRLADITRHFAAQGEAIGLEAEEVETLIALFRDLAFEQEGFQRRAPGAGDQRLVDPFALISEANRAIEVAIGQIDAFQLLTSRSAEGVEEALARVALTEVMAPFSERLASTLSGSVSEALKDEEGELETSAKEFVDRFVADIEEEILFQNNLAKIREAGGKLLAEMLNTEGAENAGALAESFLDNPELIAGFERGAITAGVAAGVRTVSAFTETIEAADFGAIPIDPIVVPITFGPFPTFPQFTGLIPGQGGAGGVTYNVRNEFNTLPAPSVASDQIASSVSNITRNRSGPQ